MVSNVLLTKSHCNKLPVLYFPPAAAKSNKVSLDISNNLFIEGKVLWGRGDVFALECEVETPAKTFKTVVLFNAWSVYMISPLDGVDIMNLFKGRLKKIKSKGKAD